MKRILILYLVSVWFCIADAEIRFNPLNVERIEGVVGVTHDELRDAISSKNPAFSNAVNETVATKADKPVHSVEDNLASITADGNLKDSGIAKTNVATKAELSHKLNDGGEVKIERSIDGNPPSLDIGNPGSLASWLSAHPFSWHIGYRGVNEAGSHLYGTFDKAYYLINKTADYEPTDKDEIAVKGDIYALASSKADRPAHPVTDGHLAALTADGNLADSGKRVGELAIVTNPVPFILSVNSSLIPYFSVQNEHAYKLFNIGPAGDFVFGGYNMVLSSGNASKIHYRAVGDDETEANEIAVKGDISDAISATNQDFSDAVLAVGLNIDTNSVAVLNEIAANFGDFPIKGTATTIGALLAALAAAVAWLKKKALIGGLTGGVPDDPKVHDFFTESNSLLTGTIDARLPYPLYAVPSTGLLKDRAINTTSLASVTVPDNFTDLLVRASVASSLAVTMPEAIATKYGDTFPGEAGEYLITITKTGAAEAYVRTIKLEEVA